MKYRKGDICRVVGNSNGHHFKIGAIVTLDDGPLTAIDQFVYWKASDANDFWWVREDDMDSTTKSGLLHYISLQIKSFI